MNQRAAHLLYKTFAMAAWGRDVAQYPWLGQVRSRRHQMRGFTKPFEAAAPLAASRIQAQRAEGCELVRRDYVPNFERNEIGCEEVNLFGFIIRDVASLAVMPGVDDITAAVGLGIGC